ncbi:DUF1353 domain-containing protein [Rhizobium leguminosarum]|uniref:DUF1353 domain-containing protein n=1 Tax=Rhizobium leguminosarum TaxID=384 RepID=UPI001C93CA30|nr:DUF1353 domain-containing protein [Rhizobium leguminosarum]MBY5406331.1 hypothetical protein [Rhizobium leguminosarum]
MVSRLISIALVLFATSCTSIDYNRLSPGEFTGTLFVMWVGEGGSSGDGRFVFVPDPNKPLTFTRPASSPAPKVITPGIMYTDGGSIPKIAQVFNRLSPWGYAPAYMIHDWLFVARQCLTDGSTDPRFQWVAHISFHQSAEILGEAIKALVRSKQVRKEDVAASAITLAVTTPIARKSWDAKGACKLPRLDAADLLAVDRAVPRAAGLKPQAQAQIEAITKGEPRKKAVIVNRLAF